MKRGLVRRGLAVSLLLVGVAGITVPGLDAVLYHQAPTRAPVSHVDRTGGCDSHAEHCVLAPTLYAPRVLAPASPSLLHVAAAALRAPPLLFCHTRSSSLHHLPQPRAPPTDLT